MNGGFDWSSLQVLLVLAREGRLTVAARRAGIDHATLKRRLMTLEDQLGTMLFERTPTGYVLTPAGRAVMCVAEEMESVSFKLGDKSTGLKGTVEGMVRIAAPDVFGQHFLAPQLGTLVDAYPALEVQLVTTPRSTDLSKREADMAITGQRPAHGRLHSVKITDYELGLYATQNYLDRASKVRDRSDLAMHRLIGHIDELVISPEMNYLAEIDSKLKPRIRSLTASLQIPIVLANAGIATLPCWFADEEPRLVRLLPDDVVLWRCYWLSYNSDMRKVASVRVACDFILKLVNSARRRFAPRSLGSAPVARLSTAPKRRRGKKRRRA